jgi:hypothetical protein
MKEECSLSRGLCTNSRAFLMNIRAQVDDDIASSKASSKIGIYRRYKGVQTPPRARPRTPERPRLRTSAVTMNRRCFRFRSAFFSFAPLPFAAQFRLIFCELTRGVFAGKPLLPAPQRVLGETLLRAVFANAESASAPGLDVQRPPLAARFVLTNI